MQGPGCHAKSATATTVAARCSFRPLQAQAQSFSQGRLTQRGPDRALQLCPQFFGVGSQRGQGRWKALAAADWCAELFACGGVWFVSLRLRKGFTNANGGAVGGPMGGAMGGQQGTIQKPLEWA